ncbi:hypothetical protein [Pseudomonas sp. EGD-AK9]|uniref:hypothetical protein n=1 Tax=Pseudomonas sp. EGD-AK9 TaxID=1386078 RepID=UPI0012E2A128|nr:hypothetical protein [Pseudomonas sp. EGD-AK9]
MSVVSSKVDYLASSRRHIQDAYLLHSRGRLANAGQLFGFSVECGLKAVLVGYGVTTDTDGNIPRPTGYREHLPKLGQLITGLTVFPDGRSASFLLSRLPSLGDMHDWSVDHRYWRVSAIPLGASLGNWELAALEVDAFLDEAISQGII